jgi:hypothetical protein
MNFEELLPLHKCSLTISHNDHRDYYETVKEYYDIENFESREDFEKCVIADDVWMLNWYPDTPIGSYTVCGSSLERLLERAKKCEATNEL